MSKVRLSGGGAKSPFWHQMFADIFGPRVVTLASQEGSAYGAALLALVGTGEYQERKGSVRGRDQGSGCETTRAAMRLLITTRLPGLSVALSGSEAGLRADQQARCLTTASGTATSACRFRWIELFTYELPPTLRHRVQRGCRVLVPFGSAAADRRHFARA